MESNYKKPEFDIVEIDVENAILRASDGTDPNATAPDMNWDND